MPKGIYIRTEKSFGHTPWNKGIDWSPKSAFKKGQLGAFTGHKHSQESKEKMSLHLKGVNVGEENVNWKGGVSSQNKMERTKFKRTIQKMVLERDNYTCTLCGKKGCLQVDHIQPWAEYVELRFSMDNCRTLCDKCHYKITYSREMPENIKTWGQTKKEVLNV